MKCRGRSPSPLTSCGWAADVCVGNSILSEPATKNKRRQTDLARDVYTGDYQCVSLAPLPHHPVSDGYTVAFVEFVTRHVF